MEGTLGRTIKGQPVGRRKMEEGAMTEEASSFSILGKALNLQIPGVSRNSDVQTPLHLVSR